MWKVMSSVFFFSSLQYIYVIYMLPICINPRQNILKILVKYFFLYKKYIPQVGAKIKTNMTICSANVSLILSFRCQLKVKVKIREMRKPQSSRKNNNFVFIKTDS